MSRLRQLPLLPAVPALVAGLLVALCGAPAAFGHAAFLGSDPQPGARLQASPAQVTLNFTEPLNRTLAQAEVVRVGGGAVATRTVSTLARRLALRPVAALARGAYRVQWHSVSTDDGHALEGSFSFGVCAAAAGGGHSLQQSPLARGGWLRVGARVLLYITLLLFTGALLLAVILGRRGESWLTGPHLDRVDGVSLAAVRRREQAITSDLGVFAVGAAALAALLEGADAAQGFSPAGLSAFLLDNAAGVGRLAIVAYTLFAVVLWRRRPRIAAAMAALALGAVAASGHASSASPRLLTILNDWVHLLAGAVWLGGIALIVLVWAPALRRHGPELRMVIAGQVLPAFGRVALPAFVVVSATGIVSLVVQLGRIADLWQTAYGRVLLVKIVLVGLIALASWWHALRLRPQMLRGEIVGAEVERRHWRLWRAEPLLGIGVAAAVALLATFPLPPRQFGEADAALASGPACDPCPLARPAADELAVAAGAGRYLVAGWLRRAGDSVTGTVRVLDLHNRPAAAPFTVQDARQTSCGTGCRQLSTTGDSVRVALRDGGSQRVAVLPAHWDTDQSRRAGALLRRVQARMRGLRAVRQTETTTSGPGSYARTRYRLRAPDRLTYVTNGHTEAIVIGKTRWFRAADVSWEREAYGAGIGFSTRSWFRWSSYAQDVRLLGEWRRGRHRYAELALMDPGTPLWTRLTVALDSMNVVRELQTTGGHFTTNTYSHFDQPDRIEPPEGLR